MEFELFKGYLRMATDELYLRNKINKDLSVQILRSIDENLKLEKYIELKYDIIDSSYNTDKVVIDNINREVRVTENDVMLKTKKIVGLKGRCIKYIYIIGYRGNEMYISYNGNLMSKLNEDDVDESVLDDFYLFFKCKTSDIIKKIIIMYK